MFILCLILIVLNRCYCLLKIGFWIWSVCVIFVCVLSVEFILICGFGLGMVFGCCVGMMCFFYGFCNFCFLEKRILFKIL